MQQGEEMMEKERKADGPTAEQPERGKRGGQREKRLRAEKQPPLPASA